MFTDVMVDLETTGKNPNHAAIIQLAAVKFNYDTGEIGPIFDRAPMWLPFRYWDEDTREFWRKFPAVYEGIVARSEPARPVFEDFSKFVGDGQYRFWAKPVSFDWPILASHYEQLDLPMPFFYRIARDLNSHIAGIYGTADHISLEDKVPFSGEKHNALHDCAFQIDCLKYAKSRFVATEVVE